MPSTTYCVYVIGMSTKFFKFRVASVFELCLIRPRRASRTPTGFRVVCCQDNSLRLHVTVIVKEYAYLFLIAAGGTF